MLTLTAEQIDHVKKSLQEGRCFFDIASDLAVGVRGFDMEHVKAVIEIAQFEPAFPLWLWDMYIDAGDRTVKVAYKHPCPRIALLDNVLSDEECDEIIARATPRLKPSKVHGGDTSAKQKTHKIVAVKPTILKRGSDEFIRRIDERCSKIMHSPVINGESLQVVRYQVGGEYKAHYDWHPDGDNGNNRCATLLMYLNDVPAGGKTFFPGLGLNITPKKGSAVYFQYSDAQGRPDRMDPQTLHGGEPVLEGEKWIVTKWARQHPYILKSDKA